jgi:uncharacterized repeat protein (TIGR03803 family)
LVWKEKWRRRSRRAIAQPAASAWLPAYRIELLERRLFLAATAAASDIPLLSTDAAVLNAIPAGMTATIAGTGLEISPTPASGKITPDYVLMDPTPAVVDGTLEPFSTSGPAGLTPAQVRHAYGIDQVTFGSVTGDGTGQTIAIVDAYDDPTASADLHNFDLAFGLPDPPSFKKVNETGGSSLPGTDPAGKDNDDWEIEESLDIEWAHATAPSANIVLIEANADPMAAVSYARTVSGVVAVSMSWGSLESSGEGDDGEFTTPTGHGGITFLAATGDYGAPGGYPAYSPNVVAVGGTTLNVGSSGDYESEFGWSGSGGGVSTYEYEAQPAFQNGAVTQSNTQRTIPDVAFDANPNSGVPVYDSYDFGTSTPWVMEGGTSLSCPCWAGIIAIADQGRALAGRGSLDGATQTLPRLYALAETDFNDITTGNNGYPAGPGYDLVTGLGSPIADTLIPDLVKLTTTTAVTSSNSTAAIGSAVTFTATVTPIGGSGETGTVQFQIDDSDVGGPVALSGNTATFTTSTLTPGSHFIVAVYSGDSNFAASISPTVTQNSGNAPWALSNLAPFNERAAFGGVVLDPSGNVFGETWSDNNDGTVYEIQRGSGAITTLASFNGDNGQYPEGGVVLDSSGNLYGTTENGGIGFDPSIPYSGDGTVFEIAHGSGVITTLALFNDANGDYPSGGVVLDSSGNLFGTTFEGGNLTLNSGFGWGTVFEIAQGSDVVTTLASFADGADGAFPESRVVLDSSGDLFGTNTYGGPLGYGAAGGGGTVFEVAKGSGVITSLAANVPFSGAGEPAMGVTLDSAGNLFGTTYSGGSASGDGTVYEIARGSGVATILASFNGTNGLWPQCTVALDTSGNLFGTTEYGGANDYGTVFEIGRASGVITTLASFNSTSGQYPAGGVVMDSSGDLFSTVENDGESSEGTVFELARAGTAVASSNSLSIYGQSVTFTATVSPGSGETGTVQFQIDGSDVGNPVALSGNTATYTTSTLAPGSYDVVAIYSGDNNNTGSTSPTLVQAVAKAPTTTDLIASNASPVYGQSVTFTATVTPVSGSGQTGTVQIRIDNVGCAMATAGATVTYTTSTLSAGSHTVVAVYSGDGDFAASNPAFTEDVAKAAPSNTLSASTLVSFNGTNGKEPYANAALDSSGNVFGTTEAGGANGDGAVFEIAYGSGAVTTLASFNGTNGKYPYAGAVLDSSGDLFGTTNNGGAKSDGEVFEVAHGSSIITVLASFNGANGNGPRSNVVLDSSGDLFGTAHDGGNLTLNNGLGVGTVFEIGHGSGVITTLASFNITNGQDPLCAVILDSSGDLFGTTEQGGANGDGAVYEIAQGSGVITALASFNGSNGEYPYHGLVLDSSGDLLGTTHDGGNLTLNGGSGAGTVFEISRGSGAITTLASFNGANGQWPDAGVVLDSSGDLYGTTFEGGNLALNGGIGDGTVFEIAQGSGAITTLVSFDGADGQGPEGGLDLYSSGSFLGTTYSGGANGDGIVYELTSNGGTAVTSSNASPVYGQPVTFTATVTPAVGAGPTGTVQFQIDGDSVGSPVALVGNTATYTTSSLDAGSHSVVAVYSGDGNFLGTTSPTLTQSVLWVPLTLTANTTYVRVDADKQHLDVWNNATATGTPNQSILATSISNVTYTGPAGRDLVVIDYSNGDPVPAGGISLTGGAGQNTLEIIGDPAGDSDTVAINGGAFTIPAGTPGAGTANYALGTVSIAAGASLALGQSDSQADQTVLAVNNLSVAGTLDISNNTLLANETNLSISQLTTLVQNAGVGASIFSSLVTGPDSQASRAVGYGDSSEDPLSVPAGDVEVKYVPFGDTNLDGTVDITDLTRAINNLGLSPGYYGGDVANQGLVNITDIADIINDLGAQLNAGGDSAGVAAAMAPAKSAGRAIAPPAVAAGASPFSDAPIQADWLTDGGSIFSE